MNDHHNPISQSLEFLREHLGILLRGMLIIFISVYCVTVLAQDTEADEWMKPNAPNFEPLASYGSETEGHDHRIVFDSLIGDEYAELWMIGYTESAEYAVRIGRKFEEGRNGPLNELDFQVIYSESKKSISAMLYRPGARGDELQKMKKELKKSIPVKDVLADISAPDAKSFIKTWFDALITTRYLDQSSSGLDATSYEFYANGRAGKALVPGSSGIPGLMAESGECLIRYVKAPSNKKRGTMDICLSINEKLRAAVLKVRSSPTNKPAGDNHQNSQ